jgi:hypothetical protein
MSFCVRLEEVDVRTKIVKVIKNARLPLAAYLPRQKPSRWYFYEIWKLGSREMVKKTISRLDLSVSQIPCLQPLG